LRLERRVGLPLAFIATFYISRLTRGFGFGPLVASWQPRPYSFLSPPNLPCGDSPRVLLRGSGCGGGGIGIGRARVPAPSGWVLLLLLSPVPLSGRFFPDGSCCVLCRFGGQGGGRSHRSAKGTEEFDAFRQGTRMRGDSRFASARSPLQPTRSS